MMTFSSCNYTVKEKKALDTAVPEFVSIFISIFNKVTGNTKLREANVFLITL